MILMLTSSPHLNLACIGASGRSVLPMVSYLQVSYETCMFLVYTLDTLCHVCNSDVYEYPSCYIGLIDIPTFPFLQNVFEFVVLFTGTVTGLY